MKGGTRRHTEDETAEKEVRTDTVSLEYAVLHTVAGLDASTRSAYGDFHKHRVTGPHRLFLLF